MIRTPILYNESYYNKNYNYICTELKLMKDESVCNYRQICRT